MYSRFSPNVKFWAESAIITTIIPTFRRPQLLKRAIESALNQTTKNNRIFISDNALGDTTQEIVQEYARYDPSIQYFCQHKHVSVCQNYASALQKVSTPYFSFIQNDDYLLPWFYELALEGMDNATCVKALIETFTFYARASLRLLCPLPF